MSLVGPTEQDQKKLHAEVNQLVNQRFLLTTLSITVFGVMSAWMLPKDLASASGPIGEFRFGISSVLIVMLFLMFFLGHRLNAMIRTISTYLIVTKASGWETDWQKYRNQQKYVGYTKPQSTVFLVLGLLAGCLPFLLWAALSLSLEPRSGVILILALTALYVLFVAGMAFGGWFDRESDIESKWKTIE